MLSEKVLTEIFTAHGTLGCLAWAVVMPLGAISIRLVPSKKSWIIHGGIMLFGLLILTTNFGIGISQVYSMYPSIMDADIKNGIHYTIGITLFSIAWAQPFLGYAHHFFHKIAGQRSVISGIHVFFGRVLMLFGIVNGGLGLLAGGYASRAERIAYGTVVAAIWLAYIVTSLWFEIERQGGKAIPSIKKTPAGSDREESRSRSTGEEDVEKEASQ